jgi:hypothetical protein|tara:strand:- start:2650 stop:2946 length:297 start_codon:yes stop_codon:yes gene_type:complete
LSLGDKKVLGYKIRNPNTGLYLSSISAQKWTKIGKTWPRRCDAVRAINFGLKALNRMSAFNGGIAHKIASDCLSWELVELTESGSIPLVFMIDKIKMS